MPYQLLRTMNDDDDGNLTKLKFPVEKPNNITIKPLLISSVPFITKVKYVPTGTVI